jgi:hypothetical protein
MIKDEQPPATVIPTDLRSCTMHRAAGLPPACLKPEKRAGMGKYFKNRHVPEEVTLVRIDLNRSFFPGILV